MDLTDLFPDDDVPPPAVQLPGGIEPELETVLAAFNENNQRWRSHRWLAQLAARCGSQYRTAHVKVLWDAFGRPFWKAGDDTWTDEGLHEAIRDKIEKPDSDKWTGYGFGGPYALLACW